ncbi:MAG: 4Fe-4S dicluster domain-containing protein [Hyphomicrobiaceae bacterium]|nr:4Fe-4S dicluster domain-containing protein [Hyphomicrobiaceae bacterium]
MTDTPQKNTGPSGIDEAAGQLVVKMILGLLSLSARGRGGSSGPSRLGSSRSGRRSFLKKGAAGITSLLLMGLPFAFARLLTPAGRSAIDPTTADKSKRNIYHKARRNILRPPGALQNDAEFISACIGCGLCGEVCPPHCIKFHKSDGGSQSNTPFINASEVACILCNKCMEVCPTKALTVTPRPKIDMGIAQIDRSACYPWVDRGICGACVSICPLGKKAISHKEWNQYQPIIHSACVGCGLCVEICPHPSTPIWIVDRAQGTVARHSI